MPKNPKFSSKKHGKSGGHRSKSVPELSRHKRKLEEEKREVEELVRRVVEEAPRSGSVATGKKRFDELPISKPTLKGGLHTRSCRYCRIRCEIADVRANCGYTHHGMQRSSSR